MAGKWTRAKLPGVVVAEVGEGISDVDLGSIESFGVLLSVGYLNGEHFVGLTQIQSPPGVDVVLRVSAGAVLPLAARIPVDGVIGGAEHVQ